MIGCTFFDHRPLHSLPLWATISEVSAFLAIPRRLVRSVVRQAVANNEMWVKKDAGEMGMMRYLINTSHERYLYYQEQWLHSNVWQQVREDTVRGEPSVRNLLPASEEESPPSFASALLPPSVQQSQEDVLLRWPSLRLWLSTRGVQVYGALW